MLRVPLQYVVRIFYLDLLTCDECEEHQSKRSLILMNALSNSVVGSDEHFTKA